MTGSRKADIASDDLAATRPHIAACKIAVGFVRRGVVGAMFIRAGGWHCFGCVDEKAAAILEHLERVVDAPVLWLGELDSNARRSAARQARRLPRAGRVTASRIGADALVLAEANLTPRARLLRPAPTTRAVTSFIDHLRDGPTPKRVDWGDSWRPTADVRSSDPAVRAGMGPADLWAQAVEAAGFRTGVREVTGLSDVEIAEAIEGELDRLRSERDSVAGWTVRPKSDIDNTHHVS